MEVYKYTIIHIIHHTVQDKLGAHNATCQSRTMLIITVKNILIKIQNYKVLKVFSFATLFSIQNHIFQIRTTFFHLELL